MKSPRIPRIDIRPDAYVLRHGPKDFELFVRSAYVGGFRSLWNATVEADRLLANAAQLERAA